MANYNNGKYLMDAIVMYHNRQQAVGNIMTALVLGKPVFMKSENVVYKMLKNIGVSTVYDIKQMFKGNILSHNELYFRIC